MPMKIQIHLDLIVLLQAVHQAPNPEHLNISDPIPRMKLPIQILAHGGRPPIPNHHPININHGDNHEYQPCEHLASLVTELVDQRRYLDG